MPVDLMNLGVSVEVTGVDEAESDLRKLGSEIEAAQKRLDNLGKSGQQAGNNLAGGLKQAGSNASGAAQGLTQVAGAAQQTARATNMTTLAWTNLGYQVNDVISGLAMGQPPLQILAQQGGQVYSALSAGPGGVAGALKEVGSYAAALLTPVRVLGGGFLAAGAAALYLGKSAADANRETQRIVSGIGLASQATVDDVNNVADAMSASMNISVGSARQAAQAFLSTGVVHRDQLSQNLEIAKNYGKMMGMSMEEAGEQLAEGLRRPSETAQALSRDFNTLSADTAALIRNLEMSGDRSGAAALLMSEIGKQARAAAQEVGWLRKEWNEFTSTLSRGADRIGQGVAGAINSVMDPSKIEQAADAQAKLTAMEEEYAKVSQQGSAWAKMRTRTLEGQIAVQKDVVSSLQEQIRFENKALEIERRRQELNEASKPARAAVETLIPGAYAGDELAAQVAALEKYIGLAKQAGINTDLHERALGRAATKLAEFTSAGGAAQMTIKRMNEDTQLAVQSIQANTGAMDERTWSNRAAIAAQEAYNKEIRSSGDQEVATAAARNASAMVMAQARAVEVAAINQSNEQRQLAIQSIQAETQEQQRAAAAAQAYAQTMASTGSALASQTAARNASAVVEAQQNETRRRAIRDMAAETTATIAVIQANTGSMNENTWAARASAAAQQAYAQTFRETQDKQIAAAAAANAASVIRAQAAAAEQAAINSLELARATTLNNLYAETNAQKEAAAAANAYNQTLAQSGSVRAAQHAAQVAASLARAQALEVERRAIRDMTTDNNAAMDSINAMTMEERAAAAGTQAYNQVLRQTGSTVAATTARRLAHARSIAAEEASIARNTRSLNAQRTGFDLLAQNVGRSEIGFARLSAEIQAENQLISQGIPLSNQYAQAMVRMAGAAAEAGARMNALRNIVKQTSANMDEVRIYEYLTASIGQNEVARQGVVAVMRAENQLRQAGISLLSDEAQAYIASARAAAQAAAAYQQASSASSGGGGGGGSSSGSSSNPFSGPTLSIGPQSNPQYQAMQEMFGEGGAQLTNTRLRGAVKNATNGVGQYVELWLEGTWVPTIEGLKHAAEKQFAGMEDDITASFNAAMSKFDATDAVTTLADKIQGYMDGLGEKPEMPTAPTAVQPGAQGDALTDPSAYGADKNATYYYDPNSRKSFLEQFGIGGDAAGSAEQKAYELAVQEYETAMKQYEIDLKAWEEGQKHTVTLQGILDRAMEMAKSGQSTNAILSMMNSSLPKSIADALEAERTLSDILSQQQDQTQTKYDQAMKDVKAAIFSTYGLNPEGEPLNPEGVSKTQIMNIMSNTHQGVGLRQPGTIYDQYNKPLSKVPGFAEGGSFTVGGEAGRDANRVMMDLTKGERVDITPAGKSGKGGDINATFIFQGATSDDIKKSRSEIEGAITQILRRAKERS